jgi:hypothetical protein
MKKGRSETMFSHEHMAAVTEINRYRNSFWPAAAGGNGAVSAGAATERDRVMVTGVLRGLLR